MHTSYQCTDTITATVTAQCTSWLDAQWLNRNPDISICHESQAVLVTDHLRLLIKEKAALAACHFPVLKHIRQHLHSQTGTKFQSLENTSILPMNELRQQWDWQTRNVLGLERVIWRVPSPGPFHSLVSRPRPPADVLGPAQSIGWQLHSLQCHDADVLCVHTNSAATRHNTRLPHKPLMCCLLSMQHSTTHDNSQMKWNASNKVSWKLHKH